MTTINRQLTPHDLERIELARRIQSTALQQERQMS